MNVLGVRKLKAFMRLRRSMNVFKVKSRMKKWRRIMSKKQEKKLFFSNSYKKYNRNKFKKKYKKKKKRIRRYYYQYFLDMKKKRNKKKLRWKFWKNWLKRFKKWKKMKYIKFKRKQKKKKGILNSFTNKKHKWFKRRLDKRFRGMLSISKVYKKKKYMLLKNYKKYKKKELLNDNRKKVMKKIKKNMMFIMNCLKKRIVFLKTSKQWWIFLKKTTRKRLHVEHIKMLFTLYMQKYFKDTWKKAKFFDSISYLIKKKYKKRYKVMLKRWKWFRLKYLRKCLRLLRWIHRYRVWFNFRKGIRKRRRIRSLRHLVRSISYQKGCIFILIKNRV